jgi:hypothetical protein
MNNLEEHIPIPNGIKGSSEDPPRFIYGSYRAAGTEAHREEETSRQSVAHVSSAVGGSVSTLSFEDTPTMNRLGPSRRRGGGIRERMRGFSRTSRTNLLRRLASINRDAFRAFKGRVLFVTLTYSHEYPKDPEACKAQPY